MKKKKTASPKKASAKTKPKAKSAAKTRAAKKVTAVKVKAKTKTKVAAKVTSKAKSKVKSKAATKTTSLQKAKPVTRAKAKPVAKKVVAKTASKTVKATEKKFPGYPKYPASEDIMNRGRRVLGDLDSDEGILENAPLARTVKAIPKEKKLTDGKSNVTKEDLLALESEEHTFKGDDKDLEDRTYPVDFAGEDLDVPGSELDDKNEARGNEDEENNLYSLGGDNHNDLEEDQAGV